MDREGGRKQEGGRRWGGKEGGRKWEGRMEEGGKRVREG